MHNGLVFVRRSATKHLSAASRGNYTVAALQGPLSDRCLVADLCTQLEDVKPHRRGLLSFSGGGSRPRHRMGATTPSPTSVLVQWFSRQPRQRATSFPLILFCDAKLPILGITWCVAANVPGIPSSISGTEPTSLAGALIPARDPTAGSNDPCAQGEGSRVLLPASGPRMFSPPSPPGPC